MKPILVTGGAGFIGSHLCERLVREGHQVVALDNFNDYYDPAIKRNNLAWLSEQANFALIEGDILDLETLRGLFEKNRFETVVHLAARAGVRPSIQQPLLYEKVNVEGTMNLLELAREFGTARFVFGSSSSVYGKNERVPFSESDPVDHPISPYAATKKAGEIICYTYHHLYGLPVTCLRFFTVYGPRQRPDMAIHKFTRLLAQGRPVPMFGDGRSRRDYTYIADIVDGIVKAMDRCRGYHIYNLGESQTIALKDLIALIAQTLGVEAKIERLPEQPGDVPITFADISRAQKEIGYDPKTGIEEGIGHFVKWFRETAST